MTKPASSVPFKNILLLWSESSGQSALNRPLSTWSESEDAIHAVAKVAPSTVTTRPASLVPGQH
jgi:hypothetical protein